MKYYTFIVCFDRCGVKIAEDVVIRAKHIGDALAKVMRLKGYVSSHYTGKAH